MWSVNVDLYVTMANFNGHYFPKNGISLYQMKKIAFHTVSFMFLAFVSVRLLISITFRLILGFP